MPKLKINKRIAYFITVMVLLLIPAIIFLSCEKEEQIVLKSFSPNPAIRGGELRFTGINLDQVTAIEIPGSAAITSITTISESQIMITIPQNAEPGYVTLKTPMGDIRTKEELNYIRPFSITKVSDENLKAGEILEIEGENLDLIKFVIFSDLVVVPDTAFISQSLSKIEVKVPAEARTGKVAVSNGAVVPIEIFSTSDVSIVLPSVTKIEPVVIKAGKDITISGVDLDLVDSIKFSGDVVVGEFIFSEDSTEITVKVPDNAHDGVLHMIAKSGVEVKSEMGLTLIMPTNLSVEPSKVKNGETLTISGQDLDLVSEISFGQSNAEIISQSETELQVTVPFDAATKKAKLTTLSTKTVETPSFDYIVPTITSINPTDVIAGSSISVTGTDLDLVVQAKYLGAEENENVIESTLTSLLIGVAPDAVDGAVTLITGNGTQIISTDILKVTKSDLPIVRNVTSVRRGELMTITGFQLDRVESVVFENNKPALVYGNRTDRVIEVFLPLNAQVGEVTLTIKTTDSKELTVNHTVIGTYPVADYSLMIWDWSTGIADLGRWGGFGQQSWGPWGQFYEITAESWNPGYWMIGDAVFSKPSVTPKNDYVVKMDVRLLNDIPAGTGAQIRLNFGGIEADILPYLLDETGTKWSTNGVWKTITMPISEWDGLPDPTPSGPPNEALWGITSYMGESVFIGFGIDNIRYEKK